VYSRSLHTLTPTTRIPPTLTYYLLFDLFEEKGDRTIQKISWTNTCVSWFVMTKIITYELLYIEVLIFLFDKAQYYSHTLYHYGTNTRAPISCPASYHSNQYIDFIKN